MKKDTGCKAYSGGTYVFIDRIIISNELKGFEINHRLIHTSHIFLVPDKDILFNSQTCVRDGNKSFR